MDQKKSKVQVTTRIVNLVICIVFLCISIKRVNMNQWGSDWIWNWGLLILINAVLLVIKPKDLKYKE